MKMRIALLAHRPENELSGGIKTVVQHLKSTFPQLEIFPKIAKPDKLGRYLPWFINSWKNGFSSGRKFLENHRIKAFDLLLVYPFGAATLRPKRLGIPVINIYFGCFPEFLEQISTPRQTFLLQKWITRFLDKKSGKGKYCMTISEPVKNQIKKRYGFDCRVIPVGVDVSSFQPLDKKEARALLQFKEDAPMGLFIGRAEFAKGWDILLKVAELLPHITFVCVINASIPKLPENIVVRQNISKEEMILWHNAADFFFFPSRYESAALVVLEAMACNLPVIISQPVADVCIDGKKCLKGVHVVGQNIPDKYRETIETCLKQKSRGETRDYVVQNRSLTRFEKKFGEWALALLIPPHEPKNEERCGFGRKAASKNKKTKEEKQAIGFPALRG